MRTRQYVLLLAETLLLSISANAQRLSVKEMDTEAAGQKHLVVSIEEGSAMTAMQFNLKLPPGVVLSDSGDTYCTELGIASTGHTLCVAPLASGDILFLIYSMDLKTFNDGELLRIPVTTDSGATTATVKLHTIHMADTNAVSYIISDAGIPEAIRSPKAIQKNTLFSPWYTLDGQSLTGHPARRGVYVQKRRKVVVK